MKKQSQDQTNEQLHIDDAAAAQEEYSLEDIMNEFGGWSKKEEAAPKQQAQTPPEPQKPEDTISKLITRRVVSVASQIVFVLRSLWKKRHVSLKELFRGKNDPSERVAAFLAVLELVKDKRLRVDGDGEDCEIKLTNGGE